MRAKNILVSFMLALFLVAGVSAFSTDGNLADVAKVSVDGMNVNAKDVSVVAGEEITVKVYFEALEDDTDVTVEAEIEGEKAKAFASTGVFDVEEGYSYKKVLTLRVPYELKDEVSNNLSLEIEIDGKKYKTEVEDIALRVQRPSYNAVVKSVVVPSSIDAGETFPVEVVLKNMGYNDLDDVYVSAQIASLGLVQGPKWFGDLAKIEECSDEDCDKDDTVFGRLNLEIPYNAKSGVYALEVVIVNDDTESRVVKEVVINNDFSENVISTSATKTVAEGEDAVYDLLIVNPTNNVKVYKIVTESEEVTSSTSQAVLAVPAGSSKTVKVTASSQEKGNYEFNVNVFDGEELVKSVAYGLEVEGKKVNTIFVLTIVLAVIFLVLLVALIVLLGKKPEKSEEFGESYY